MELTANYYFRVRSECINYLKRYTNIPEIDKEMLIDEVLDSKPNSAYIIYRLKCRLVDYFRRKKKLNLINLGSKYTDLPAA